MSFTRGIALMLGLAGLVCACGPAPPSRDGGSGRRGGEGRNAGDDAQRNADPARWSAASGGGSAGDSTQLVWAPRASELGTIDEAMLANMEATLSSEAVCGLGRTESRVAYVDGLGKFDKLPYLVRMVQARYTDVNRRGLPQTAIEIMVRMREREKARPWLEAFVRDPTSDSHHRLIAAAEIAQAFRSPAGMPILIKHLASKDVSTRSYALSHVVHSLDANTVKHIVPVSYDPATYMLDRLVDALTTDRYLVRPLSDLVKRSYASLSPDQRARAAYVLMRLGDNTFHTDLAHYLTHPPLPRTPESLDEHMGLCEGLALNGHKVGLDGAAAVIAAYDKVNNPERFGSALRLFYDLTTFTRNGQGPYTNRDGQEAIQWWQQNRRPLSFRTDVRKYL